jgi:hypothetical protein
MMHVWDDTKWVYVLSSDGLCDLDQAHSREVPFTFIFWFVTELDLYFSFLCSYMIEYADMHLYISCISYR